MRIENIAISKIQSATYNPRKNLRPGDPEYTSIERSIQRWGMVEPLIWNERTGNLVSGHQRIKVLIASGNTHVLASVVDLDLDEEKALNLALNKITGSWDDPLLLDVLAGLEVDLSLTGFKASELDALARSLSPIHTSEALFTPAPAKTDTGFQVVQVTTADVEATARRLETRFDQPTWPTIMEEVVCLHCGGVFIYDVGTAYRFGMERKRVADLAKSAPVKVE